MTKQQLIIAGIVAILLCCIAGFSVYKNRQTKSISTTSRDTPVEHSYSLSDEMAKDPPNTKSFSIKDNGAIIKVITLKDIPSFDDNEEGQASIPEKDYAFDLGPALDSAHGVIYFSVYNQATGGNANVNRALFSYNIVTKNLKLLKKEEFTVSFGDVVPSADGDYLVYSEGVHGGYCSNTMGLGFYDVKNGKVIGTLFLPRSTNGSIYFDHWINDSRFVYQVESFSSDEDCISKGGQNPKITYKIHQIVNSSTSVSMTDKNDAVFVPEVPVVEDILGTWEPKDKTAKSTQSQFLFQNGNYIYKEFSHGKLDCEGTWSIDKETVLTRCVNKATAEQLDFTVALQATFDKQKQELSFTDEGDSESVPTPVVYVRVK